MGKLQNLSQRTQQLKTKAFLYNMVLRVIPRHEAFILALNKQQLSEGLNIRSEVIGTYSPKTEAIARQESTVRPKIAGQPYNFQWTGELFRGMYLKVFPDRFEIFSRDDKSPLLEAKYSDIFGGNLIFGLTDENCEIYAKTKLLPDLRCEIRKHLGLA